MSVSLVLQVEQAKQLTHQALLSAETTGEKKKRSNHMGAFHCGKRGFSFQPERTKKAVPRYLEEELKPSFLIGSFISDTESYSVAQARVNS